MKKLIAHFHLFKGDIKGKKIKREKGLVMQNDDIIFWENVLCNLRCHLEESGVTEKSFSTIIQFYGDTEPVVYFI